MLSVISPNQPAPQSNPAPQTQAAPVQSSEPVSAAASDSQAPSTSQSTHSSSDTVTISSAGQQALQEAKETPAQTAHEASHGDPVAKRLLAKEAAAKANG